MPGYYSDNNSTNDVCVQRKLNDICDTDVDCSVLNDSVCSLDSRLCVCDVGYTETDDGTDCRPKQPGDPCDFDQDCNTTIDHSVCSSGLCACEIAYLPSANGAFCVLRKIGDTCVEDVDCSEAVTGSLCVANVCECQNGYMSTESRTTCIKSKYMYRDYPLTKKGLNREVCHYVYKIFLFRIHFH